MSFYPIQAILLYLSLLFAPADTQRIHIRGVDFSGVLIRDASGWNLTGPEDNKALSIEGTRLVDEARGEEGSIDLKAYVSKAAGHDWEKEPKLTLPDDVKADAFVIEKTPDGFKLRNNRGTEGIYEYDILYIRKDQPTGATCNVLGAVQQPGVIALHDGDTLRSVLLKAGGPVGKITPYNVFLLRGAPGKQTTHYEGFRVSDVLAGRHGNPVIRDRDNLYVEPTVLLELARDGALAVDGQPCAADELQARLRDRVETGVRIAVLQAHRETPNEQIEQLRATCNKAGIPPGNVILDSASVPD
jgi:hypothetical protein